MSVPSFRAEAMQDYYRCAHPIGGTWGFGQAPKACDANTFGSDSVIQNNFAPLVFDHAEDSRQETDRYMTAFYPTLRDLGRMYIHSRNPDASEDETQAWLHALFALAQQESYWTHYRKTKDGELKMMRGDRGHGHGIMQLDDRSHREMIDQGKAWDLFDNMTLGMDIYYAAWKKAARASCVTPGDWVSQARAAYGAYNGGPGSICRFQTTSRWSANDVGFYQKWRALRWQDYAMDIRFAPPVNVACLFNGYRDGCGAAGTNEPVPTRPVLKPLPRKPVIPRITIRPPFIRFPVPSKPPAKPPVRIPPRPAPAPARADGFTVGQVVMMVANVPLFADPHSGVLRYLGSGEEAQVLTTESIGATRIYRVRTQRGEEGYVSAAGRLPVVAIENPSWNWGAPLARAGGEIEVVAPNGIWITSASGTNSARVGRMALGERATVLELRALGANYEIYYRVRSNGTEGYIYAGKILPGESLRFWTQPRTGN